MSKTQKTKRPAFNLGDEVRLADHMRAIPAYADKPAVLCDTVLRVSHITGRGTKRDPWAVVATDRVHFWHFEPSDLACVK